MRVTSKKKNKMKINTKKSVLLSEDFEILTLYTTLAKKGGGGISNYFLCCDNFSKVKSVILYFVRLSLAATIMQKHKFSSTLIRFKLYSESVSLKHPIQNKNIEFLS